MTSTVHHFKNKNWYQCFKDELYKQPGVTQSMTTVEAATVVSETNLFIARQLQSIQISEEMDIGHSFKAGGSDPEFVTMTRLDLIVQDYIARYVSLKDKEFARSAGGKYPISIRARLRWCELYLLAESCL